MLLKKEGRPSLGIKLEGEQAIYQGGRQRGRIDVVAESTPILYGLHDVAKFTFVFLADPDKVPEELRGVVGYVLSFVKYTWHSPERNRMRYPYDIAGQYFYAMQINKIIEECGFTHVQRVDAFLLPTNPEAFETGLCVPHDDEVVFVSKQMNSCNKKDRAAFARLLAAAKNQEDISHESALEAIAEMIQVIWKAGLWRMHKQDTLFVEEAPTWLVAFVGHQQPQLGGNPWLSTKGDSSMSVYPWCDPNRIEFERNAFIGMQELVRMLLGLDDKGGWPEQDKINGPRVTQIANSLKEFAQSEDYQVDVLYAKLISLDL